MTVLVFVLPLCVRAVIFTLPSPTARSVSPSIAATPSSALSTVQALVVPFGRVTVSFVSSPTPSRFFSNFKVTDFGAFLTSSWISQTAPAACTLMTALPLRSAFTIPSASTVAMRLLELLYVAEPSKPLPPEMKRQSATLRFSPTPNTSFS